MYQELENLHRELLRLIYIINEHGWSRQITKNDAQFIGNVTKKLQEIDNRLFHFNHRVKQ